MGVIVHHPYTKFEVRRPPSSEDMADFRLRPGDFSTAKWGHESLVSWVSFLPIFSLLYLQLGDERLCFLFRFQLRVRPGQTDRQTVTINALCPTLISVSFNTPKGSASHTKKTLKWNTKKQTQCTATTGTGHDSCRHTRQTYEPSVIYDVADRVSYVRCDVVEHQ